MSTYNITRYLHTSKKTKNGTAPLYCKINVGQTQKTFSFTAKLGIDLIDMNRWKATECFTNERKMTPAEREIKQKVDNALYTLKRKAERFTEDKEIFSADDVYNAVYAEKQEYTLMDAFAQHKKTFDEEIAIGNKKKSSYKKYETVKTHLQKFLRERHKTDNLFLAKLDNSFQAGFNNYLMGKLCDYSRSKYVKHLRTVLTDATEKRLLPVFPFNSYKGCKSENHKVALTKAEVQKIKDKEFTTERLNLVKDIFVFNCYTGYAWCDLSKLTYQHIKNTGGRQVIITRREKTNVPAIVSLTKEAEAILAKYKDHPEVVESGKLFPFNTNQKQNEYLKEVQTLCGIEKTLTTKVARNTFATVAINSGVKVDILSRAMGHTNTRQTNEYAEVAHETMINELDKMSVVA